MTTQNVNFTRGAKVDSSSNFVCLLYGKVLLVSYYVIATQDIYRNDVILTLDIPSPMRFNNYDGGNVNLDGHTKNLLSDRTLTAGSSMTGQVIGMLD